MRANLIVPAVIGFALAATAAPGAAQAAGQVVCAKRDELMKNFDKSYKEVRSALGVADTGELFEVLVGPRGSWTLIITPPGGPACIAATGKDWAQMEVPEYRFETSLQPEF